MSILDQSCKAFIDVLASKAPVPGGGGAAALGGAIGMALSNMVGNLTVGKKKYADVEGEILQLIEEGTQVIQALETLTDKDAEVFEPLSKAYGLPKGTEEEIALRDQTLETCSKAATLVPLDIMRAAYKGIKIQARMGEIGTLLAISDVACSAAFLNAALVAASMNVIINLNSIKDKTFVDQVKTEIDQLLAEGAALAESTIQLVKSKM